MGLTLDIENAKAEQLTGRLGESLMFMIVHASVGYNATQLSGDSLISFPAGFTSSRRISDVVHSATTGIL